VRKLLLALLVLAAAGAFFAVQQTNTLRTARYTWQSDRVPPAFDGFRIVQVSDLHNKRFGKEQKRLLAAIREAGPDMIALTGDFADKATRNLDAVEELLAGTQGLAPIYFVEGNHDLNSPFYGALLALLSQYGVTVLDGYAQLERDGESMRMLGFGYWTPGEFDLPADIALSHSPDGFPAFARQGFGLVLSGHIHGGQIALPNGRAFVGPNGKLFPRYSHGEYRQGDSTMLVSRGLGISRIPFRLFAPPEIVVIELKKG